jgi:hypothetical protein
VSTLNAKDALKALTGMKKSAKKKKAINESQRTTNK